MAESCASDVRGKWDPFERAVRAEGRQAGLTRPRLPVAVQAPLYIGAGVVGVLAFAAVDAVPHTSGVVAPLVAAFFAFIIPVTMVGSLSQKDRLTGRGAAVGAWAAREAADAAVGWRHLGPVPASSPAELSALALAVAAGAPVALPGASPGLASGVRPGPRTASSQQTAETPRPAAAWSSVGGQWRLVKIGPTSYLRLHPAAWLPLAALLAVLALATSLLPTPFGELLPLLLAAGAAAAAVAGVPNVTGGGAAPPGQPVRDLMAPGELFRLTPGPPGPLLTPEEVTAAVGRPVEATAFQVGILGGVYRGEELTVSLTVATGALGGLSSGPARRWGRPVPGIGDEAWLINRHHTVVFRVGNHTGKITVSGAASCALPPDVLPWLATTVAGRLAASMADHQPGGAPSPETLG